MKKPEDMHRQFTTAFNKGNVEDIMALYIQEATLVSEPGQTVKSRDGLRQALLNFLTTIV